MNLTSFARPRLAVAATSLPSFKFEHADTVLSTRPIQHKLLTGFTVWAAGSVKLGWDWVQSDSDVIALYAPMSIFANTLLLDGQGMPMPQSKAVLELNKLVWGLPWQVAVAQHVAASTKRGAPRHASALMAA